jgi:hypothetical protein
MEKRKGLMTASELTDRMSQMIDFVKFNIYILSTDSGPGMGFDFGDFDTEKEIRKKFETALRELIEEEMKRHYDIIPG